MAIREKVKGMRQHTRDYGRHNHPKDCTGGVQQNPPPKRRQRIADCIITSQKMHKLGKGAHGLD